MTPLIVDIAHAAWSAWHSRTSLSGAFDILRTDLDALTLGRDVVLLAADSPPYLRAGIDPAYKANRHGDDPGRAAVRGFLGALKAAGWALVGERGHEADDVIATLVTQAHAAGIAVDVATGDKDLAVLAPFCGLLRMSGEPVTPEAVEARWGVPPVLVPDLLAIAGDSSDNIPGARGVGAQSAALVLRRYRGLGPLLDAQPMTAAEIDAEAKAVEKAKRAAKKDGADPALLPLAEDRARDLAVARTVARIHEQREAVERSAALVRLKADLPLDLVALIAASKSTKGATDANHDHDEQGRPERSGEHVAQEQGHAPDEQQLDLGEPLPGGREGGEQHDDQRRGGDDPAAEHVAAEDRLTTRSETMSDTTIETETTTAEELHTAAPLAIREPQSTSILAPLPPPPPREAAPRAQQTPPESRFRCSSKVGDLMVALSKAQGEMTHASRTAENPHLRRKYADLASVLDAVRGPLSKHGLALIGEIVDGHMVTRIYCGEQWVESEVRLALDTSTGRTPVQALGSALTYLRRYVLQTMTGIAADDDDGESDGRTGYQPPQRRAS